MKVCKYGSAFLREVLKAIQEDTKQLRVWNKASTETSSEQ